MKVRDTLLEHQDDIGTSGTKTYNLDYADLISGIDLDFGATNGATDNKNNPIERCVSKIEVVDGSDVLWSLPGYVAYGMFAQEHGHAGDDYYTGAVGDTPYVSIPIRFGRELYDPLLSLNPRAFRNPQLRVTFDEATIRAAGATGYVSDSFTLSIIVRLMEESPLPQGFLMAKEVENFTSLGSGDHVVDMPTDHPYRMMVLRAYESGTDLRGSISALKLSCDGAKVVPFDDTSGNIVSRMCELFSPVERGGYETADNGDAIQTWIGVDLAQALHASSSGVIATGGGAWPGVFTIYLVNYDNTPQTNIPVRWRVVGWAPHNTVLIPFGRLGEIGEWFNAPSYGSVKLYLTQGDADADVNVCVQQYRTY